MRRRERSKMNKKICVIIAAACVYQSFGFAMESIIKPLASEEQRSPSEKEYEEDFYAFNRQAREY